MSFINIKNSQVNNFNYSVTKEVIQVNNFGTYSYATLIGLHTRKYHGLLVAPQPQIDEDQHVFLSTVLEEVKMDGMKYELGIQQYPGLYVPNGSAYIVAVEIDPITKITYHINGVVFTKEIVLLKHKNSLLMRYTLVDSKHEIELKLKPFLAFRNKHTLSKFNAQLNPAYKTVANGVCFKLYVPYDDLYLQVSSKNQEFIANSDWYYNVEYALEKERGYDYQEDVWLSGYFIMTLKKGESIIFSAGLNEMNPNTLKSSFSREIIKHPNLESMEDCLENAAKQFIVKKDKQIEIIAGYPWFGRWGRDTFIALPGLTLSRGDAKTCKSVIDAMVLDLRGSLFPNMGNGDKAPINSVDAPLWFFWTLQQYAKYTDTYTTIWKKYGGYMKAIFEGYKNGTQFNIKMQTNGLIYAGEAGKALTWMDAAFQGKIFTPRIGCPVEINALWYNAVCFGVAMADLANDKTFVKAWKPLINNIKTSFIKTFWNDEKGYLADVVNEDESDWSIRPNQIFATSLPYIPLNTNQCKLILQLVKKELLTPRGLRTLNPNDEKYIGVYHGNQWNRDRAYHQGTVWPWLLGHFAEGYLKCYPIAGLSFIESIYKGFSDTLHEHGLGTISEVYDGNAPHKAGGAISQAWSVAELIRMHVMIKNYRALK